MERVERIENLNVRGCRAQGIVSADGIIRTCIVLYPPEDCRPMANDGSLQDGRVRFRWRDSKDDNQIKDESMAAVDAWNRLVAGELERRWNEKLAEVETTKQRLSALNGKRWSLSSNEEERIRLMSESFAESWQSDHCPPALKKMIFRTAIEEVIVRADTENKTLQFTIHWSGGAHTQLKMERPRSATETATPAESLEIIRRMAVRQGDDQIASVLHRLGHSAGKGKRWNQERVATARRNHSIPGQKRALPDPDRVSLSEAARICGVSHRLVEAGLLKREQTTPAPRGRFAGRIWKPSRFGASSSGSSRQAN